MALKKYNKFISLSGIDSSGKSTQISHIDKYLTSNGQRTKIIWSRGGYTPLINSFKFIIRKINPKSIPAPGESKHRDRTFKRKWVRVFWLNFALFDMLLYYCFYYRVLKTFGYTVIADRYLWDTFVDFKLKFIEDLFDKNFFWKILVFISPKPDISIILTLPIEESLRRSDLKNEPFSENIHQRKKRFDLYCELIEQGKWGNIIDGTSSIDEVSTKIENIIV